MQLYFVFLLAVGQAYPQTINAGLPVLYRAGGSYFTLVWLSRMHRQTLKQKLIYCAKHAKTKGVWGMTPGKF